jgi:signal transduction histidine kinase
MTTTTTPVPEPTGSGAGVVASPGADFTEFDARRMNRMRRFFARRPRASDVLVCGIVLIDTGTTVAFDSDGLAVWRIAVAGLLGLAAVGTLWFRRRSPVVVLGLLAILAAGNVAVTGRIGGFALAIGFGVYAVAASRTARMTWWIVGGALLLAGLTLVAADGSAVTRQHTDGAITFGASQDLRVDATTDISNLVFTSLIALVIGTSVSSRRTHVNGLLARHRELMAAGEQQATLAAATEKTRIAREMHDVVAHGLTVMVALSDGARTAMRRSPEDADRALELLSETGRTALTDMRRMLGVLRGGDAPLEPQPQDLDELVQSFRMAGMTVHLTTSGPALPEDPTLALTVYRVVQESLTNALRHAGTHTRAEVIVARTRREVLIEVTDSGPVGLPGEPLMTPRSERLRARLSGDDAVLPVPPRPGRGLVGMRERAAVYGGTVSAGPHQNGWRVQVLVQIDDAEEDR